MSENMIHTHVGATAPQMRARDKEMIPTVLLRAMLMLALTSLALVTYAVLTDRPLTGQPQPAPEVAARTIVLDGERTSGDVVVRDGATGTVLADLAADESGFVSVIWRALTRERMKHGVAAGLPVRLVEFENGRLAIIDDETGWTVELGSFGATNRASFAAFIE